MEYSLIVQYKKQNKQKMVNYQIKTGSSKAPIVEMWSWLSIERRVSQRGRLPLNCLLDQKDHGENLVYWMRRVDGYGMDKNG